MEDRFFEELEKNILLTEEEINNNVSAGIEEWKKHLSSEPNVSTESNDQKRQQKNKRDEIYAQNIFPFEVARLKKRAAHGETLELLFVTVGDQPDAPTLAAVAVKAQYIIFLATTESKKHAETVIKRLKLDGIAATICEIGDGKDFTVIYDEIFKQWRSRKEPKRVGIDMTGGYKTMSAVAAIAAFALPSAKAFYIDSDNVITPPNAARLQYTQKQITLANPYEVFGDIERKNAAASFAQGEYVLAADTYKKLYDKTDNVGDRWLATLARSYNHLERADWKEAVESMEGLMEDLEKPIHQRTQTLRSHPVYKQKSQLEKTLQRMRSLRTFFQEAPDKADPARDVEFIAKPEMFVFIAFLLAQSKRYCVRKQYDIAMLLAYRALEGIFQRRYFETKKADPSAADEKTGHAKGLDELFRALEADKDPLIDKSVDGAVNASRTRNRSIYGLLAAPRKSGQTCTFLSRYP